MLEEIAKQIPASHLAYFRDVSHQTAKHHASHVFNGGDAVTFIKRLVKTAEELLIPLAAQATIACASGCVSCCVLRVEVTSLEAQGIAEHLWQTRPPQELLALLMGLWLRANAVAPLDARSFKMQNNLCPLLVNDRCSVYEVRPMACVGCNSLNKDACDAARISPEALVPMVAEVFMLPNLMISQVAIAQMERREYVAVGELSALLTRALITLLRKKLGGSLEDH